MSDSNSLLYLRARYYTPTTGTFLSPDPVEGVMARSGSRNGYSYVEGNPVNYRDPSGKCPLCLVIGAGILLGGLFYAADPNGAVATADWVLRYSGTYDLVDEASYVTRYLAHGWFGYKDGLPIMRGQVKNPLRQQLLAPYQNDSRYQQVRNDLEPWGGLVTLATVLNGVRSIPTMINGLGNAFSVVGGGTRVAQLIRGGTEAVQEALSISVSWGQVAVASQGAVGVASGIAALSSFGCNMMMAQTTRPIPNTAPPGSNGSSSPFTQDQLAYEGDILNRNNTTNAGRAVQKHISPSRGAKATLWQNFIQNLTGGKLPTTATGFNEVGAAVVDHIVMSPDTIWSGPTYVDGIGGINVLRGMLPSGVGIQWDYITGEFIGFVP